MPTLFLADKRTIRYPRGLPLHITPALVGRFWAKIDRPAFDECWPWTGARNDCGYGVFGIKGFGTFYAHRLVYLFAHGAIPRAMVICHGCDCPPCCNPFHLELGTQSHNVSDSVSKGRHSCLSHPEAVEPEQSQRIAAEFESGRSRRQIAQKYGVGVRVVYKIGAVCTDHNKATCPAQHQNNRCLNCRQCWDRSVKSITYPLK